MERVLSSSSPPFTVVRALGVGMLVKKNVRSVFSFSSLTLDADSSELCMWWSVYPTNCAKMGGQVFSNVACHQVYAAAGSEGGTFLV